MFGEVPHPFYAAPATFLARVRAMPPLVTEWGEHKLWPAQITAIRSLEKSLAQGRPRALIQMATGIGETFTAMSFIYRLIKFAGVWRVLFLVGEPHRGERPTRDRRAGLQAKPRERAQSLVQSFYAFIAGHRDETTALQILYNRPTRAPLRFEDIKALADTLQAPPHLWTGSQLWQAYAALDQSKVRGAGTRRILTDLVSLVRYAMHQENELVPYPERVMANFRAWLAQQAMSSPPPRAGEGRCGGRFTDEQRWWLEKMAEHIASNLGIEAEDFGYAPFDQRGGLGRVHQPLGAALPKVIGELNAALVA
jgi:hypothetical protein